MKTFDTLNMLDFDGNIQKMLLSSGRSNVSWVPGRIGQQHCLCYRVHLGVVVLPPLFSLVTPFPLDPKQTCAPISAKSLRCQTISLQVAS